MYVDEDEWPEATPLCKLSWVGLLSSPLPKYISFYHQMLYCTARKKKAELKDFQRTLSLSSECERSRISAQTTEPN